VNGRALAEAAEALVGARFRLHGRDFETGLDCVGVLEAALRAIGRPAALPTGYALRARRLPELGPILADCGLGAARGPAEPGDVVMLRPGPCQHHLVIAARNGGFVHAHAGLRRVVLASGPLADPIVHRWRLL
jgi:hypothetical protein